MDPHPDAVALYSGCNPGKCRVCLLNDRHAAFLVGLRGGWRHARMKLVSNLWIQSRFARLTAETFIDSPFLLTPKKSLNFSRCVISEPDLLCTSEAEILERLSDQGVG
ncbi:hypothetical protein TNCV_3213751 [Trichonephila clavipes]|nr:hypothetical protein TNCV_3213751 [Trichonephila clavipes]